MRGRKPLTAAQPEAPEYQAPSSPLCHQPPLDHHYFTSRGARTPPPWHVHGLDLCSRSIFNLWLVEEAEWRYFVKLLGRRSVGES